jgi:hypothetical protein
MVVFVAWWDIVFFVRLYLCALPFPASSCPVVARAALMVVGTFLVFCQPLQVCWDVAFQFPPQILVPGAHLGVFLAGVKSHRKEFVLSRLASDLHGGVYLDIFDLVHTALRFP